MTKYVQINSEYHKKLKLFNILPTPPRMAISEARKNFHLPFFRTSFNLINDNAWLHLPGDSKNIEKTIIDKTAEITSRAMHIPRQFLFSVDDIASSWKWRKKKGKSLNSMSNKKSLN